MGRQVEPSCHIDFNQDFFEHMAFPQENLCSGVLSRTVVVTLLWVIHSRITGSCCLPSKVCKEIDRVIRWNSRSQKAYPEVLLLR